MQSLLKLFRGRSIAVAMPSVSMLEVDDVRWAVGVIAGVFRKMAPQTQVDGAQSDKLLLGHLADLGLEVSSLSVEDWLDDAKTPLDTKILVIGEHLRIILGRKEGDALLLEKGARRPQTVPFADLQASLGNARLYALASQDESSPEAYGWRWFLKAFFSRKKVIRDALITSLVIQLVALGYPLATQAIVDKVITNQAVSTLIALGVGIGLFAFFNAMMSWLRQKLMLRLANVVDADLSTRVMAHLFRLPLRYFEARPTGVLITRVHGIERIREFASGAFLLLALELPFMFIFLALMLSYSGFLSGVVLGFVAVMVVLSFACGPYLRELANMQFEAGAKLQGYITERVAAHETVKSLQLENASVSRFSELNRKQLDASLEMREFASGYGTFMQLLEQLMNAAVLCLGAYLAMTSTSLTIGMLMAFQMFAQRVSQPLIKLSGMWQELQQVRTAVSQLGDVMGMPTERYGSAPTSAGKVKGKLDVITLGFRHAADRPPLYSNLSFSVEPGQVVLVTGASGSGKSTLAKIMQGLYTDYDGFVKVDGRDIRSMAVNELRGLFGVVPQETVLFAGTIIENVMAGASVSFEQAIQACRMAGIHDVLENLPQGYQTVVGERGVGLSGGQRQRIGIARALLKRPAVLVFDEATSGLDDASAEQIAQTINYLRGKATVFFVAHKIPAGLVTDVRLTLAQ